MNFQIYISLRVCLWVHHATEISSLAVKGCFPSNRCTTGRNDNKRRVFSGTVDLGVNNHNLVVRRSFLDLRPSEIPLLHRGSLYETIPSVSTSVNELWLSLSRGRQAHMGYSSCYLDYKWLIWLQIKLISTTCGKNVVSPMHWTSVVHQSFLVRLRIEALESYCFVILLVRLVRSFRVCFSVCPRKFKMVL